MSPSCWQTHARASEYRFVSTYCLTSQPILVSAACHALQEQHRHGRPVPA
jgi:hypothetical protein